MSDGKNDLHVPWSDLYYVCERCVIEWHKSAAPPPCCPNCLRPWDVVPVKVSDRG